MVFNSIGPVGWVAKVEGMVPLFITLCVGAMIRFLLYIGVGDDGEGCGLVGLDSISRALCVRDSILAELERFWAVEDMEKDLLS